MQKLIVYYTIYAVLVVICLIKPVYAGNLDGILEQTESDFNNKVSHYKEVDRQRAIAAAEASRNRDRSKDVCYTLPSGSDAQIACLGKYPNAVRNDRARNILLGYCYSLGASTELNDDLSYICSNGVSACSSLDNGEAAYWCGQCGGTRRWLAVYSLGHTIQCFK